MGRTTARTLCVALVVPVFIGLYMLWRRIGTRNTPAILGFAIACSLIPLYIFNARCIYYDLLLMLIPWALTVPVVEFDQIKTLSNRNLRYWCWLFLLFPVLNWVIIWARVVDGGPAHQPVMLLLFVLAWLNLQQLLKNDELKPT
jgi:hypothetical protein